MLDNVCLGVGYSHQSGVCLSERPIYLLLYQLAKYYRKGYFAYRLWHLLKKYYTQSDEQDDLISIGTIGLIKGVSSYRPEKGTRLATYAAKCVENEILMYFRSRKKLQGEVSLNDSLDSDADGESLYLMDVVGVEDTMYLDIQDRDDCLRVRKLVHECLTEREEEVIISRYGLGGRMPRTQREVAKKLGISRSYVSRIEKRALQKLEEALGERE